MQEEQKINTKRPRKGEWWGRKEV